MTRSVFVPESDLHAFVDGEIDPQRRAHLVAYLSQDPDAASKVDAWRGHGEKLRAAFAPVLDEPLPLSLSLTLTPPAAANAGPTNFSTDRRRRGGLKIGFAAGLMLGLALGVHFAPMLDQNHWMALETRLAALWR